MEAQDRSKTLGQVFTPPDIVELILDHVGFTSATYRPGTRILEPSFGEGVFIDAIIDRIHEWGAARDLPPGCVAQHIDDSVHGVEYDPVLFQRATQGIKQRALHRYNLELRLPHLLQMDALDLDAPGMFDYVVGNPPYVRIHNMDEAVREKVRCRTHATGTTDLYIIFYELGLGWLAPAGKLGYIAPNSWMGNTSQRKFREELVTRRVLKEIIDYGSTPVFPGVSTYTCVTILDQDTTGRTGIRVLYRGEGAPYNTRIPYGDLLTDAGAPIRVLAPAQRRFLKRLGGSARTRLGDLCVVQNGLATLGDKYFLRHPGDISRAGWEDAVLLPAVKASTYRGGAVEDRMVFPYAREKDGRVRGLTEEEFASLAPHVYKDFVRVKSALRARALDRNSAWFWYGRSQAVQTTFQEKLVFSPIVGPAQKRVTAHIVSAPSLVYSGLFITALPYGAPLEDIQKIVQHKDFCSYMKALGKHMNGGYRSMSSRIVQGYPVK